MALKTYEFDNVKDMERFLQGWISGGKNVVNGSGRIMGLHNKTLIFTTPAGTVTFSDASGDGLTLKEVSDQITAAIASLSVSWKDGWISIHKTDMSDGVTLSKNGTANTAFGFSTAKDNVGLIYNGPTGATPRLVESNVKARRDGYYVIVEV